MYIEGYIVEQDRVLVVGYKGESMVGRVLQEGERVFYVIREALLSQFGGDPLRMAIGYPKEDVYEFRPLRDEECYNASTLTPFEGTK